MSAVFVEVQLWNVCIAVKKWGWWPLLDNLQLYISRCTEPKLCCTLSSPKMSVSLEESYCSYSWINRQLTTIWVCGEQRMSFQKWKRWEIKKYLNTDKWRICKFKNFLTKDKSYQIEIQFQWRVFVLDEGTFACFITNKGQLKFHFSESTVVFCAMHLNQ